MSIKCIKKLKRADFNEKFEEYVDPTGAFKLSEYDAGIKIATELHQELFDGVNELRAQVLGEKSKVEYTPFTLDAINKKYGTLAIERQAQAEKARIKALTPKKPIAKKPVPTIQDVPEVSETIAPPKVETPKKPIAKKHLTEITEKGNKTYWKVEFPKKVKESLSVEPEKATSTTTYTDGTRTDIPDIGSTVFSTLSGKQGTVYQDEDGDLRVKVSKTDAGFYSPRNWARSPYGTLSRRDGGIP